MKALNFNLDRKLGKYTKRTAANAKGGANHAAPAFGVEETSGSKRMSLMRNKTLLKKVKYALVYMEHASSSCHGAEVETLTLSQCIYVHDLVEEALSNNTQIQTPADELL